MTQLIPPPAGNDKDLDEAIALLKRTKKRLRELPADWEEWVVESLAAWQRGQHVDESEVPE